jgi:hypothetical protein
MMARFLQRWKWPDISAPPADAPRPRLAVRLLWMAAIWGASVLVLLVVAQLLRLALRH